MAAFRLLPTQFDRDCGVIVDDGLGASMTKF
jgi:hypothetical protein